jgi:hypothetical protein
MEDALDAAAKGDTALATELAEDLGIDLNADDGYYIDAPTDVRYANWWDQSYKNGVPGTYREILVTLPEGGKPQAFQSSHWNEPNILVHIRADEVMGVDGKRYLRVGEIQSDWGQEGKKAGFGPKKRDPVRVFERASGTEVARLTKQGQTTFYFR